MTAVEQKVNEGYQSFKFLIFRTGLNFEEESLSERTRDGVQKQAEEKFFLFPEPVTCHHPKLIMSWKLSLRRTAELGFNCFPSPLLFFFSLSLCPPPLPSFSLHHIILPLYLSPICNSLLPRPYLCLPLTLTSSLLSFHSSNTVSLFFPLIVFFFFFYCYNHWAREQCLCFSTLNCLLSDNKVDFSIKLAVIRKTATLHPPEPLAAGQHSLISLFFSVLFSSLPCPV